MSAKSVVYCPNSRIHAERGDPNIGGTKSARKILFILDEDCIYIYCSDSRCMKDRKKTWTKVSLSVAGKPVRFQDAAVRLTEMKPNHHFDLEKLPVAVVSNA